MNTVTTISNMNNGTASNRVEYYYICGVPSRMLEQINIYFVLMCFVKPAMSILGITANIISLQILRLSGLHKPSNILLFSLVIADTLCLGRSINYGAILFWFGPDDVMCGFRYSEGINYFLLYSMIGMQYFHLWGEMSNTMFPVLITFERLVAVFKPLTFSRIINRRRTIVLVVCAYLIWLPWTLFLPSLYEVGFSPMSQNVTYMRPALSKWFFSNILILNLYDTNVNQTFSNTLPLIFVTFGNIVLGIKVSVALKKRRSLTSSQKMSWSPRTTRTLMLTCFIFVISTATGTIMTQMDNNLIEDVASYYVRREVRILLLQINSSSSLFIYIASNRRFFDIFCSMFGIALKLIKPHEDGI
ncbi:G-protein coupled receptor [Biomphalaria glabrata]|nr:putative G-protein coupled receptor [Biomphalaria glabrata]